MLQLSFSLLQLGLQLLLLPLQLLHLLFHLESLSLPAKPKDNSHRRDKNTDRELTAFVHVYNHRDGSTRTP